MFFIPHINIEYEIHIKTKSVIWDPDIHYLQIKENLGAWCYLTDNPVDLFIL